MATRAPVYDLSRFYRVPTRLPQQRKLIGLKFARVYFIPIFDSLTVNAATAGHLGANLSAENNFQLSIDWTWLGATASFSAGSAASPPFAYQLFRSITDDNGNQQGFRFQKTPINAQNGFGTAQRPYYLPEPVFLPAGTELLCRVQNLQAANNVIQLVLFGELQG